MAAGDLARSTLGGYRDELAVGERPVAQPGGARPATCGVERRAYDRDLTDEPVRCSPPVDRQLLATE